MKLRKRNAHGNLYHYLHHLQTATKLSKLVEQNKTHMCSKKYQGTSHFDKAYPKWRGLKKCAVEMKVFIKRSLTINFQENPSLDRNKKKAAMSHESTKTNRSSSPQISRLTQQPHQMLCQRGKTEPDLNLTQNRLDP